MSSLFGLIIWYSLIILVGSIIIGLIGNEIKEAILIFIMMEVIMTVGMILGVFWMTGGLICG